MVTIKELSDSIGVSKVGITKWIERHGYKDHLQKIGNKYYIPADVEQAIRANFDRREQKQKNTVSNTAETDNTVTSEILALLREQLEVKDREIERLHAQIESLQKINADTVKALRESNTLQAMQLSDGSDRIVEDLHDPADHSESVATERTENEPRKTVSFLNRIRRMFG